MAEAHQIGNFRIPLGVSCWGLLPACNSTPLLSAASHTGQPYPKVSTLNSPNGDVIANAAIVPAGTGGEITVVTGNPTDLIIDIVGYFAP